MTVERRWRAAQQVGLSTVPCLVASYSDEQAAQIALIENTHREALDPIAQAQAMQRLAKEFDYTHEELAAILGISREKSGAPITALKTRRPLTSMAQDGRPVRRPWKNIGRRAH